MIDAVVADNRSNDLNYVPLTRNYCLTKNALKALKLACFEMKVRIVTYHNPLKEAFRAVYIYIALLRFVTHLY